MSEDLNQLVAENRPLPERDPEALPPGPFAAPRYTVLATEIDRNHSAARAALQPVFQSRPAPALLQSSSDLGDNTALFFACDGTLEVGATARLGFDYHWLREIAPGAIASDLGLQVDGSADASIGLSLAGAFLACVTLDRERWLRLRFFQRSDSALDFTLHLAASAQARSPLPDHPEQLVLAILGVHNGQWLEALARLAKDHPGAVQARFGAAATRFLDLWRSLDTRASAAIWNAAGSSDGLAGLRDWVHRIATELRDQDSFKAALDSALASTPDFAGSPAGLWMEAAAGGLLSAVTSLDRFRKLVRAAQTADELLGEPGPAEVLAALKRYALEQFGLAKIQQGLGSLAAFGSLDDWLQKQLGVMFGGIATGTDLARALRNLGVIVDVARSAGGKALAALEKKYSAELRCRCERAESGTALLDCSFNFTEEGLGAYRAAFAGDFSFLSSGPSAQHVKLHRATLTHGLSRQAHIELHLPFLNRKEWKKRWEALARVEIESGADGRLFGYTCPASDRAEKKNAYQSSLALAGNLLSGEASRFTLTYTDERSLSLAQARATLPTLLRAYGFEHLGQESWPARVESSLTLSVPGNLVAAWLRAPGERSPDYFPVYSAVSVAVQRALRQWLPFVYFSDLHKYEDLGAAFPLVVYQSMRPCPGRPRSEFAYDVMNPGSLGLAKRPAQQALAAELGRISQLLIAAGMNGTARFYSPGQASSILAGVLRKPQLLHALLVADASFVDSLVKLGVKGRELSASLPRDPNTGVRDLAKFCRRFVATFHHRLRRLYGGQNFVPFGSLLLLEATRALGVALDNDASIAAVLRLTLGSNQRTFVNAAFRP